MEDNPILKLFGLYWLLATEKHLHPPGVLLVISIMKGILVNILPSIILSWWWESFWLGRQRTTVWHFLPTLIIPLLVIFSRSDLEVRQTITVADAQKPTIVSADANTRGLGLQEYICLPTCIYQKVIQIFKILNFKVFFAVFLIINTR